MRLWIVLAMTVAACGDNVHPGVVVVTTQNVWIHPSNPVASQAISDAGAAAGWKVTVTDDATTITPELLARTDVIVFSVTSGDILDDATRARFEQFFADGGGFVGVHSASYTEFDWPFYMAKLVPVAFLTHPYPVNVRDGVLTVEDPSSPVAFGVPNPWDHVDEFYTFQQRPEDIPGLHIVLALDEDASPDYPVINHIGFHALGFTHELSGGRTFYTALGHTPDSYSEPAFMDMLTRGIAWAAEPHLSRR